jgi:hypothetical protein
MKILMKQGDNENDRFWKLQEWSVG